MSEYVTTCTVGFGFTDNVNGLERTQDERDDFSAGIQAAVRTVGGTVLFVGCGTGVWEGTIEPAGAITFTFPIDARVTARKRYFAVLIADLAARYAQDCIAVTYGDATLIAAKPLFVAL